MEFRPRHHHFQHYSHSTTNNIQSGYGSTVIPIEKYNETVDIGHSWKNNCEKLEEDNYVKEQSVKKRDGQLQNQNIKMQDEIVKK